MAEDVERILPFLRRTPYRRILCPFDTAESRFVKVLTANGYDVAHGDLWHDGKNFFTDWDFAQYDCVVSNPPFSRKTDALKTLYDADVPFIVMFPINGIICADARAKLFKAHADHSSVLIPAKRLSFMHNGRVSAIPMKTGYFMHGITSGPIQVFFERAEK